MTTDQQAKVYLKGGFVLRTPTGTWKRRVRGPSQGENPLGEWPWVLGIGYVEWGSHSILFQYPWLLEGELWRESLPAIVNLIAVYHGIVDFITVN